MELERLEADFSSKQVALEQEFIEASRSRDTEVRARLEIPLLCIFCNNVSCVLSRILEQSRD